MDEFDLPAGYNGLGSVNSGLGSLAAMRAMSMGMMGDPTAGLDVLSKDPIDPGTKARAGIAGVLAPTKGGSFGEAFSNMMGAQSGAEMKEAELRAHYLPLVANALMQRQMMAFTMASNQYKLTQDWSNTLTGNLTGLLTQPEIRFQDAVGVVGDAVRRGQVPGAFAQQYLQSLPKDPAALKSYIKSSAVGLMGPDARLGAVSPKVEMQDTGGERVPLNVNPNAPGGVGPMGGGMTKTLSPAERQPKLTETPFGPRLTDINTGNSDIAGTPGARAIAAQAAAGSPPVVPESPYVLSSTSVTPRLGGEPPAQRTPTPPALGTSAAIDPARLKYSEAASGDVAKYEGSLNDKVDSMRDLNMRVAEMREQAKKFTPGAGGKIRLAVGSGLKDLALWAGLNPDKAAAMADKIANGNIGSMQEFQKLSVQGAMESLRAAVQSGRITQAEFAIFQKNNPSIELDPDALDKVLNFTTQQYQRAAAEQSFLNQYKQTGADLTGFRSAWEKRAHELGYNKQELTSGQTQGAVLPNKTERVGTSASGRAIVFRDGHWVYQ